MEETYEKRSVRRERERAELAAKKANKKKPNVFAKNIGVTVLLATMFIGGNYGYDKLVLEPRSNQETITNTRLDKETITATQELKEEFATSPLTEDLSTGKDDGKVEVITDLSKTPIPEPVATYDEFGVLYIPKLGDHYSAVITAGDETDQISGPMAVDYYPGTAMPGQIGNYILAGHIGYSGMARFETLHTLEPGDEVFTETEEGWYRYVVTGSDVVRPDQVEVLAPVPNKPEEKPTKAVMTMTTCYYEGLIKNRLAVWADYKDFTPRSEGKPVSIKA